MSLSSATCRIQYTGNGTTATYAYTFKIYVNTELVVIIRNTSTGAETVATLTTHYTVSSVGETAGGNVVLVNAGQAYLDGSGYLATGYTLTIMRVRPRTQLTDIKNQGSYFPETHEDTFDQIVMLVHQLQDQLNRVPMFLRSSPTSNPTLAEPIAGEYLRWNSGATGVDSVATLTADYLSTGMTDLDLLRYDSAQALFVRQPMSGLCAVTGTRAAASAIVAGTGVAFSTSKYLFNTWYIAGSGGACDVSVNPQISAGQYTGQKLRLIGTHDTNTVKFEHGTGLSLMGDYIMGDGHSLDLEWDGTNWAEVGRNV